MTVSATFQPSVLASAAGQPASFTLRLENSSDNPAVLQLSAAGPLAAHSSISSDKIHLGPNERADVKVVVELPTDLPPGIHPQRIDVLTGLGETVAAEAAIEVSAAPSPASAPVVTTSTPGTRRATYDVQLTPSRSSGARSGKHHIVVDNTGSDPVMVEVSAVATSGAIDIDIAAPLINVDPGKQARVELQAHPRSSYWSGGLEEHAFTVTATGDDRQTHSFDGVFEQGPRLRPWLVPAIAGALGGLALGTLAWFALLRPATESIADDRAATAIAEQQAEFDAKIAELEAVAAEARQLPLGAPADLRLNVEAAAGATANESYTVASDRILSVTDVVFQNPGGAVGRVALLRNGDVLLESEMANFRDLDFHFVAPFRFNGSDTVEITLECESPGPNQADCAAGVSVIGFVDQAG